MKVAVYGSLRRGGWFHQNLTKSYGYGPEAYKFIDSFWLTGFSLYSLGSYPCAVKDDINGKLLVEVFECSRKVAKHIKRVELDAGYQEELIPILSEVVPIYLYAANGHEPAPGPKIESGDWIKWYEEDGR